MAINPRSLFPISRSALKPSRTRLPKFLHTYAVIEFEETLVLWLPTGEAGEFSTKGMTSASILSDSGNSNIQLHIGNGELPVSFTQPGGMSALKFANGLRVIIVDRATAYRFWAPTLTVDPFAPANETSEHILSPPSHRGPTDQVYPVLVHGAYFVRRAKMSSNGKTIELTGDTNTVTTITAFGSKTAAKIS